MEIQTENLNDKKTFSTIFFGIFLSRCTLSFDENKRFRNTGCNRNTSYSIVRHEWQWCLPLVNVLLCGGYFCCTLYLLKRHFYMQRMTCPLTDFTFILCQINKISKNLQLNMLRLYVQQCFRTTSCHCRAPNH